MRRAVLTGLCLALLVGPVVLESGAEAQRCRRTCRAGETRDIYGCCVPSRRTPAGPPTGSVRVEADVARATVSVAGVRRTLRLPTTIRRVRVGTHEVEIRSGGKRWRGKVTVAKRKTSRLFASVTGAEWPQSAADHKRARGVLEAALKAKGGDRVAKLKSARMTGRNAAASPKRPNAWHNFIWERGRKVRWERGTRDSYEVLVLSPSQRWVALYARRLPVQVNTAPLKPWERARLWWNPERVLLRHRDPGVRYALLPPAKHNGFAVDVIQMREPSGNGRVRLFIDRRSKMLVKIQPILADGRFDEPVELMDYRPVSGVAVAFKWKDQGEWVEWQKVELDVLLDASTFVAPKQVGGGPGPVVSSTHSLYWLTSTFLVDANRDGTDDIVGGIEERVDTDTGGVKRKFFAAVFDGKTLRPLWKYQIQGIADVAAGRRWVAVSRPSARKVELLDARHGTLKRTVKVSNRVESMCVDPRTNDAVFLEGHDFKHQLLELGTGKLTPSKRPTWWCSTGRWCRHSIGLCGWDKGTIAMAKAAGMRPSYAIPLSSGYVQVSGGVANKVHYAVRFAKDGRVVWRKPIAPNARPTYVQAVVSGGYLVYIYDYAPRGMHVAAVRLRDGKALWNKNVPGGGSTYAMRRTHTLRTTPSRTYLWTKPFLRVYDNATGKLLGTIGHRKRPYRGKTSGP